MERIRFNTLISDKSFERLKNKKVKFRVERLDDLDFEKRLLIEVRKKTGELIIGKNREEFISKYADLCFLIEELGELKNITTEELEEVRMINLKEKGGFKERAFLYWVTDYDDRERN